MKSSPRDLLSDMSIKTTRARMSNLPKKEIIDESIDNVADLTAQSGKSVGSTEEKKFYRTIEQYKQPETNHINSYHQNEFQNFEAIIAKKEKVIIKTLMKDQYGEEIVSYHKGMSALFLI